VFKLFKYLEHPFLSSAPGYYAAYVAYVAYAAHTALFSRISAVLTRVWNQRLSATALIEVENAQFHMGAKSQNHQLLIT
jgi:hypothetical protein